MNILNTLTDHSYNFPPSLGYAMTPRSGLLYHPESSVEKSSVESQSELYPLDLSDSVAVKGVEGMLALMQLKFPGRQIGKADMKFLGFKAVTFLDKSLACLAPTDYLLQSFVEGRTMYFSYQNRLLPINTDGYTSKCPKATLEEYPACVLKAALKKLSQMYAKEVTELDIEIHNSIKGQTSICSRRACHNHMEEYYSLPREFRYMLEIEYADKRSLFYFNEQGENRTCLFEEG